MYYTGGPDDPDYPNTTIEGMESNTVNTWPFCPTPDEVELEVIFDSIVIDDLGDGIGGGDDLEIYGEFDAGGSPGYGTSLHLRPWGDHGDCPDDNVEWLGSLNMMGTMDCPQMVKEGSISISTFGYFAFTRRANSNKALACSSRVEGILWPWVLS